MWNEKELKAVKTVYNNLDYLIHDIVIEEDEANVCLMTIKEQLPTIKQAFLKAQEPKQYLKWEDLKKLGKEIKVKLNGVEYLLCKKIVLGFPEYYLYPEGNQKPVLMCLGDNDYEKQFFNALHLEVIE